MFKVNETFVSINGEGPHAGQLAFFVRFQGCNLNCSYCDTDYARSLNSEYIEKSTHDLVSEIEQSGVNSILLTGGEPLLQDKDSLSFLITTLLDKGYNVDIETNGAVDIKWIDNDVNIIMDYKLPSSNMESDMLIANIKSLQKNDAIKFVCGNDKDLNKVLEIIDKYNLNKKTQVFLSPVFGMLEPSQIVEFIKENNTNDVKVQLQLHKIIWDPDMRGV
ncbi:putative 7-carboxy-7-deazaguanine synthase QueE [Natranaerobius trueperi]|uniref:7-carboxy-7-deazaguanine synthase n=1 Tax=Natranaerobius trueperi TaxID=759412 RepID=A0A226BY22_9FIRM|nr:putative 7-carboxy-7-deazaguanine synthase QueE [Natranaerobius trueperi]OWZ83017.1 putative 7-carboxy-7-deazaguanine synthase QueE [Natranaerobius trueperi]